MVHACRMVSNDQQPRQRPDPDDVVGAGRSLQDNTVFTMFTGAAAAFGGGSLAGQRGPRLSSKVQSMPWWVQVAFGIVLWQPILTVPLFYLVTRSWAQAAIIAACLWVFCTLVGSLLISIFAIRPAQGTPHALPPDDDD
jgi:hypothetical protein